MYVQTTMSTIALYSNAEIDNDNLYSDKHDDNDDNTNQHDGNDSRHISNTMIAMTYIYICIYIHMYMYKCTHLYCQQLI